MAEDVRSNFDKSEEKETKSGFSGLVKKTGKILLWLVGGYLLLMAVFLVGTYFFTEEKKPNKSMMEVEKEHIQFRFLEQPDLVRLKQTAKTWQEGSSVLMFECQKLGEYSRLKREDFGSFETGGYVARSTCSRKLYVQQHNEREQYLPLLGDNDGYYIPSASLKGMIPDKVFDSAYKLNYYITQRLKNQGKRTAAMQADPNSLIFEKEEILKTVPTNGQTYHYPTFITFFDTLFSFLVFISAPLLTYYIMLFLTTSTVAGMSVAAGKKGAEDSDTVLVLIAGAIFITYMLLLFFLFDFGKIIIDAFLFPLYFLFGLLLYLPFEIIKTVFSVAFGHGHLTALMMNEALMKMDLVTWFNHRFFTLDVDILSVDFVMFVLKVSVIFLFLPKIRNVLYFILTGLFLEGSRWPGRVSLLLTLTVLAVFGTVNLENLKTLSMLTQMLIEEA